MSSAAGRSFDPADPELRTRTILDHALDAFVEIDCEMLRPRMEYAGTAGDVPGWSCSEVIGEGFLGYRVHSVASLCGFRSRRTPRAG